MRKFGILNVILIYKEVLRDNELFISKFWKKYKIKRILLVLKVLKV